MASAIAIGDVHSLALGVVVLCTCYLVMGFRLLHGAWPYVVRLRWFFVSILILYGVMGGSGESSSVFGASWLSVAEGMVRVGALVVIVAAVSLLVQTTSREEIVRGLYLLVAMAPVSKAFRERVVLRATLTLNTLDGLREAVQERKPKGNSHVSFRARIGQWSAAASDILNYAINQAQTAELKEITVRSLERPPVSQWLLPLALVLAFTLI